MMLDKDKTTPEWLDPPPRFIEDIVELNRLTAPENTALTRCRASESMHTFYLIGDASGQGFSSVLWDHEGMRYDSANWSTKWKNETSNWKEGNNIIV